jgi:hypothetical protein
VRREVLVAELEPVRPAEPGDLFQSVPGLIGDTPAGRRIGDAGERVHYGIEIGRNVQGEMLEVIAGVDDHGQLRADAPRESVSELGAADAPGKRNDHVFSRSTSATRRISSTALRGRAFPGCSG